MSRNRLFVSLLFLATTAFAAERFPMGPDPELTPGSTCENSKNTPYPQKFPVCKRSVSSSEKWAVIKKYNNLQGRNYSITERNRKEFKIDHFIPLCIGGSNNRDNLWPQHESIYVQTDDIEHLSCGLVQRGEMRSVDARELVKRAKLNLKEAAGILRDLRRRTGH